MRGQQDRTFPIRLSDITHLSKSSIEIFHQCPHSWASRYLFGMKSPGGKYAAIGSANHEVIEKSLKGEELPQDQLAIIPASERPNVLLYLNNVARPVEKKLIGIEQEVRFKFNEDAPEILAYIDLWHWHPVEDRAIVIVDHKTNRQHETADLWRGKWQPRIYTWLARKLFDVEIVYFVIGYVNIPGHDVSWRTDSSGDEKLVQELNDTWQEMIEYAGGVNAVPTLDRFPKRLNENCGWCPIKSTCSSFRNATIFFDPKAIEVQLMPAVQKWSKLKLVQDLVKTCIDETKVELLKELQDKNNSITLEGREYYALNASNRAISPSDLLRAIVECDDQNHGTQAMDAAKRRINDLFSVTVGELDKLIEEVPALKAFVNPKIEHVPQKPSIRNRAAKIAKK